MAGLSCASALRVTGDLFSRSPASHGLLRLHLLISHTQTVTLPAPASALPCIVGAGSGDAGCGVCRARRLRLPR